MLVRPVRQLISLASFCRRASSLAVERDGSFATLQDTDLAFFDQLLGSSAVITDAETLKPFNRYVIEW